MMHRNIIHCSDILQDSNYDIFSVCTWVTVHDAIAAMVVQKTRWYNVILVSLISVVISLNSHFHFI